MASSSSSEQIQQDPTLAQNPSSEEEASPKSETETPKSRGRPKELQNPDQSASLMASSSSSEENPTLVENPSSQEDEPKSESEAETETKAEKETPKSRGRLKSSQTPTQSASKTAPKTENGISSRISYSCPFQDEPKTSFAFSDLLWGKVRSHPWWPGQIFDPSDASSLAAKHRRKNCHLVAYFGDKTFAWNDSSVLKPFQTNFARMAKQSKTEAFTTAVDASLAEVSRRVGAAFSCPCCHNKEFSEVRIDNTGIKNYTYSPAGDVLFIRNSFDPVKFVGFLTDLGRNPNCETERLDLAIVKSQLKAFDRFRGCKLDLPEFNLSLVNFEEEEEEDELNIPVSALKSRKRKPKPVIEKPVVENPVVEKPVDEKSVDEKQVTKKPVTEELATEKPVTENAVNENPITEKPSEKGRKKRKMSEILEKNENSKTPSRKARVGGPSGSSNSGKNKKKRLDSLGDLQNKFKNKKKFSNVGELLKCTTPKNGNVRSSQKRKSLSKVNNDEKKEVEKKSEKKSGKKKKEREGEFGLEQDYSSSSEMLSQLCLAGRDPLRDYSFVNMICSFFTGFRGFTVDSVEEKPSGEKKKRVSQSLTKRKKKEETNVEGNSVISNEEKPSGKKKRRETQSQTKGKKKEELNKEGNLVISNEGKMSGKRKKRESQSQAKRKKEEKNVEGNSVISNDDKTSRQKNKHDEPQSQTKRRKNTKEIEEKNLEGNFVISNEEKPSRQKMKKETESQAKRTKKNKKKETNVEGNSVISNDEINEEDKSEGDSVISALVLNFNDADAVPSETELNGFFTRFGPLHEDETVVLKESSRAEVVFKNRADAELAFNKAGKFDVFGKGLVSFRLSFVKRL